MIEIYLDISGCIRWSHNSMGYQSGKGRNVSISGFIVRKIHFVSWNSMFFFFLLPLNLYFGEKENLNIQLILFFIIQYYLFWRVKIQNKIPFKIVFSITHEHWINIYLILPLQKRCSFTSSTTTCHGCRSRSCKRSQG